jgi:hypothetical protein
LLVLELTGKERGSTKYPPALDEDWANEPEITHQTKIKLALALALFN